MQEGQKILQSPLYAANADTASGTVFAEKLCKEGADVAVAAFRQIKGSAFLVEETEKSVVTNDFHGKIDRVDGTENYVRVVDYKTGAIDDTAVSYYTGRKLQMQLYMSEIKGERVPAGVFYFPASLNYEESDEGRFRMKGFMNGSEEALLCGDKTLSKDDPTRKSEYFPSALKNPASNKRVMGEEEFRNFLDYSVLVARQGCKELKEGFIAPSPYEGGCDYCKYGGMCGFDKNLTRERKEPSIEPSVIANIVKEEREGK